MKCRPRAIVKHSSAPLAEIQRRNKMKGMTMNRRTFLKSSVASSAFFLTRPLWAAELDQENQLRADAPARIEKHRQGSGSILVRGPNGQAVPGATVKIEQTRHDFLFGCNFFRFGRISDPELEQAYRRRFSALLNYATLGFYWPMYEPERGRPIYDYTDQVLEWCSGNGVVCKGHPLVWDYADPRWLPRDFGEIRTLSQARVRDIVQRFKGRLDIWDVVNEPTHLGRFNTRLGEWAQSLGAVPYVKEHLQVARAANPSATLLVNDYRTDPSFLKILEALRKEETTLFDVIGIQSHMHGGPWTARKTWEVCDRFAALSLPLHFTETTVVSGPRLKDPAPGQSDPEWGATTVEGEARQAEAVPKFYTLLFSHPAVQALTWWDFSDDHAWQGAAAGLIRKDMSPKPVYDRLQALIKGAWWTRAEGKTDAQGEYSLRVFYGHHKITAQLPDGRTSTQEVHWQRGQPNRFELTLG
jgi:endo-1,4-beta-xylanase